MSNVSQDDSVLAPGAPLEALPSPTRSAALAAAVYLGVGILWIVFSDRALDWLVTSPEVYARLQTWKGVLFVLVTGVLLFLILHRQFGRRAAQAARLTESGHRIQHLVRNSPLAVVEWDANFRVSHWSATAEDIFGFSEDDVRGLRWGEWDFVHPQDQEAVDEVVHTSLAQGKSGSFSVNRNLRSDGSVIWCSWYNSWIRDEDGRVTAMLSMAQDITAERRALEEIRRLNRELETRVHRRTRELAQANVDLRTLSHTLSHDLRAPVRAVLGFGEILERRYRGNLPKEAHPHLDNLLAAGRQMDRLIDSLVEYGRLGSQSLSYEDTDPARLLQEAWSQLQAGRAEPVGEIEIQEQLPPIRADPRYLHRVFQNLLANSIQYRHPDRPLRIRAEGLMNGQSARIVIIDNGLGIPPNHRERVFQLFERLHPDDQDGGVGLGLALVKRSMELMGGEVSLENTPSGEGVALALHFPQSH